MMPRKPSLSPLCVSSRRTSLPPSPFFLPSRYIRCHYSDQADFCTMTSHGLPSLLRPERNMSPPADIKNRRIFRRLCAIMSTLYPFPMPPKSSFMPRGHGNPFRVFFHAHIGKPRTCLKMTLMRTGIKKMGCLLVRRPMFKINALSYPTSSSASHTEGQICRRYPCTNTARRQASRPCLRSYGTPLPRLRSASTPRLREEIY